jgi:flagellar biosynthesis/type III secretory pathway chaperone
MQKLAELHRQLLENVRTERRVLVQADLKEIQFVTQAKQGTLEEIRVVEVARMKHVTELAILWKVPLRDLHLTRIIQIVQERDAKLGEGFRNVLNVLTTLIQNVKDQNEENRSFLESSIEHIYQMKRNVVHEVNPHSVTYSQQGQKLNNRGVSRLITKEA